MSETLSTIANFFGAAPVTLGSFVFTSFEVPERVTSGTGQRRETHRHPGGLRTIDVMGYDAVDVSWTGIFLGVGVQARKAALQQVVQAGKIVELTWGPTSVAVLPADVQFEEGYCRIEYRITCVVLPDPSPAAAKPSLLDSIGSALGINLSGGLATVAPYLTQAQTILQGVSGVLPGAAANVALSGVLGQALGQAQGLTQGVAALSSGSLAGFAGSFGGVGQMGSLVAAAGTAANSGALSGLLGQAKSALA